MTTPSGRKIEFQVDGIRRDALLKGLNEVELTLTRENEIAAHQAKARAGDAVALSAAITDAGLQARLFMSGPEARVRKGGRNGFCHQAPQHHCGRGVGAGLVDRRRRGSGQDGLGGLSRRGADLRGAVRRPGEGLLQGRRLRLQADPGRQRREDARDPGLAPGRLRHRRHPARAAAQQERPADAGAEHRRPARARRALRRAQGPLRPGHRHGAEGRRLQAARRPARHLRRDARSAAPRTCGRTISWTAWGSPTR